jgi:hypothetical protein
VSPSVIRAVTYTLAALVVGLYLLFIYWRVRADRQKTAADAEVVPSLLQPEATVEDVVPKAAPGFTAADVPSTPPPRPPTERVTVAGVLAGVKMPCDLVPLTTLVPRPDVGDRVAFWTSGFPAEIVGARFADELERLGYKLEPVGENTLSAKRGDAELHASIHASMALANVGGRPAFPSVPDDGIVVEVWVPIKL